MRFFRDVEMELARDFTTVPVVSNELRTQFNGLQHPSLVYRARYSSIASTIVSSIGSVK